jgi:hypothetical protein
MAGAIHSTGKTDYTTPPWIVSAVREFFINVRTVHGGSPCGIDLDPCGNVKSTVDAQRNVIYDTGVNNLLLLEAAFNLAHRSVARDLETALFYGPSDGGCPKAHPTFEQGNGLEVSWAGLRVYCNPPFGKKKGEPGIAAWISKAIAEAENKDTEIILCIPDTPDVKAWKNGVLLKAQGRCQLAKRVKFGGMKTGIPKPISLVYFGRNPVTFKHHFKVYGRVENPSEVYADQAEIKL